MGILFRKECTSVIEGNSIRKDGQLNAKMVYSVSSSVYMQTAASILDHPKQQLGDAMAEKTWGKMGMPDAMIGRKRREYWLIKGQGVLSVKAPVKCASGEAREKVARSAALRNEARGCIDAAKHVCRQAHEKLSASSSLQRGFPRLLRGQGVERGRSLSH